MPLINNSALEFQMNFEPNIITKMLSALLLSKIGNHAEGVSNTFHLCFVDVPIW